MVADLTVVAPALSGRTTPSKWATQRNFGVKRAVQE
jgi:hypothetical protein